MNRSANVTRQINSQNKIQPFQIDQQVRGLEMFLVPYKIEERVQQKSQEFVMIPSQQQIQTVTLTQFKQKFQTNDQDKQNKNGILTNSASNIQEKQNQQQRNVKEADVGVVSNDFDFSLPNSNLGKTQRVLSYSPLQSFDQFFDSNKEDILKNQRKIIFKQTKSKNLASNGSSDSIKNKNLTTQYDQVMSGGGQSRLIPTMGLSNQIIQSQLKIAQQIQKNQDITNLVNHKKDFQINFEQTAGGKIIKKTGKIQRGSPSAKLKQIEIMRGEALKYLKPKKNSPKNLKSKLVLDDRNQSPLNRILEEYYESDFFKDAKKLLPIHQLKVIGNGLDDKNRFPINIKMMEKDLKQDHDFVETVQDNDSVIKIGLKTNKDLDRVFDAQKMNTPNRGTQNDFNSLNTQQNVTFQGNIIGQIVNENTSDQEDDYHQQIKSQFEYIKQNTRQNFEKKVAQNTFTFPNQNKQLVKQLKIKQNKLLNQQRIRSFVSQTDEAVKKSNSQSTLLIGKQENRSSDITEVALDFEKSQMTQIPLVQQIGSQLIYIGDILGKPNNFQLEKKGDGGLQIVHSSINSRLKIHDMPANQSSERSEAETVSPYKMQDSSYDHKELAITYLEENLKENLNVVPSPGNQLRSYGSLLSTNQNPNFLKTSPHQQILKTSPELLSNKKLARSSTNQNSKTEIRIKDDNCISIAILKSPEQLENQDQQELVFVKLNQKQSKSFMKQVKQHSDQIKIQNAEKLAIQAEKFGGFFGSYLQENGVTLDIRNLNRRKSPKQNDLNDIYQDLTINGIQKVITPQNNINFKAIKNKFTKNKLSKGLETDLATIKSSIEPNEYTQQAQQTFQSQPDKPELGLNIDSQQDTSSQKDANQSKDYLHNDHELNLIKMHQTIKSIHDKKLPESMKVTTNKILKKPIIGSGKYFEPGSLKSFEQSGSSFPKIEDSMKEILSDLHQETIKMLRERVTYQSKTLDQSTEETKVYKKGASQKRGKYEFSQDLTNSKQEFTTSKEIFEHEGRLIEMGKTKLTIVKEDEDATEQPRSVLLSAQTSIQPISTQNTPGQQYFQIIGLSDRELKKKSTNQLNPFSPRQDQYLKPSDTYLIKINDQEQKNKIYKKNSAEEAVQKFFEKKKLSQIDNLPKKLKLKPLEYSQASRKATPNMFMENKEEFDNAFVSTKDIFSKEKVRRQKCLFHYFDWANKNQWKQLQLITDVLPTSQKIHAIQKKVPSNLYKKNEHKRTQSVINYGQYQSNTDERKDNSNSVLLPIHIQSNIMTDTTIDHRSDTKFESFDDGKKNWNRVMKEFRTFMGDNSISSRSYHLNQRLKKLSTPIEHTSVMKLGLQEGQSSLIGIKMESKSSLKNQSAVKQFDSKDSQEQLKKKIKNQISIHQGYEDPDTSREYQTQTEKSSHEGSLSPNASLLKKLNKKNQLNSNLITEKDDELQIPSYQLKTTNKSKKKERQSKDLEPQFRGYQSQNELQNQRIIRVKKKETYLNQRSDPALQEANNSQDFGIVFVEQPSQKELISLDNGAVMNISTLNANQFVEDSWMTPIQNDEGASVIVNQKDFQTEVNLPSLSENKQFHLGARSYREALQVIQKPHLKELLQGVQQRFMEFEQISKIIQQKSDKTAGVLVTRDKFQNFKRFSHCADNIHLKDKEYQM